MYCLSCVCVCECHSIAVRIEFMWVMRSCDILEYDCYFLIDCNRRSHSLPCIESGPDHCANGSFHGQSAIHG